LPALARQIFYQARPKIMALTDDKELQYGYFSQTLLPDYIGETGVDWNVVYDARGHFEEPHTNRRIGCGTIEVENYLTHVEEPHIDPADFAGASVDVIGPSGNLSAVLFCEKEGFGPLFRAVNLANRYDLMIVSTKGVSVTAARRLIDTVCGDHDLPLFVLHDFDVAGFLILGTLKRDTRRYQFSNVVEVVDLGLRLADITSLEREPAAATRTSADVLRGQLAENGAAGAESDILINERVELNAMASDALIEMIERKLKDYGLKKVIPDDDLLAETYRAFHRSEQMRERFEEIMEEFDEEATAIEVPGGLREQVRAMLSEHADLRWDDAIQVVLDRTTLDRVREEKRKAKKKSGDFTGGDSP
jgi:Topoisomerase 6 subunit A/Spo11, Toprim domain